ncbi:hypothetical protein N781_00475 [Pontibacillus halophilus JSM 076056 = DSM 19796]|uniref:Uncharacterized protein n=1 Tax=Pontibacillus halophilus JSM 076056 = DSM 19796 TaxID=1385510 RepID=A0A0A5IE09_9BACI|nr:hypothetical protein [Pontibacillus halophilus]KGX94052.1 hypothetical protein N781_00475 [Pontibacillus halophilus JSM 076056 = DSM 19796]
MYWEEPIKKKPICKDTVQYNVAKIIKSGNSKNKINVFPHSVSESKSAVKADTEQEQEQAIIEEEG